MEFKWKIPEDDRDINNNKSIVEMFWDCRGVHDFQDIEIWKKKNFLRVRNWMEKLIGKLRHGKLGTEEISKPNKKYFVFFILHILCIFFFFYWYEMLGQVRLHYN